VSLATTAALFEHLTLKAAKANLTHDVFLYELVRAECLQRDEHRIAHLQRRSGLPPAPRCRWIVSHHRRRLERRSASSRFATPAPGGSMRAGLAGEGEDIGQDQQALVETGLVAGGAPDVRALTRRRCGRRLLASTASSQVSPSLIRKRISQNGHNAPASCTHRWLSPLSSSQFGMHRCMPHEEVAQ
jgi:hypothetical protein